MNNNRNAVIRLIIKNCAKNQTCNESTHDLFIAIGFLATQARQRKFELARARGYTLPSYVHPSAWVAENVRVGANTLIQEQAVVSPFATLGDDVFLCPQVGINHHTRVGAHCFFAPASVVARSRPCACRPLPPSRPPAKPDPGCQPQYVDGPVRGRRRFRGLRLRAVGRTRGKSPQLP